MISPLNSRKTVSLAWVLSIELTTLLTNVGSEGSVTFGGLNPDRGLAYTILIRGTSSDGTVVTLSREFHVGKQ